MDKTPSLNLILASRDNRVEKEKSLLDKYPESTLIVVTVVMPGAVKQCRNALIVGNAAVDAINQVFSKNIIFQETNDLFTGFESYTLVDKLDSEFVKSKTLSIEDNHPLGRLMDIDVMRKDLIPITRKQFGHSERKCILCDSPARICMRKASHSYEQLLNKIDCMINEYVRRI